MWPRTSHFRMNAAIKELHGDSTLEEVSIVDTATGAVERVPAKAVFCFIGAAPRTDWLAGTVATRFRRLHPVGSGADRRQEQAPTRLAGATRSGLARNQHRWRVRCRRRAQDIGQAHGVGDRRGRDVDHLRASASAQPRDRDAPAAFRAGKLTIGRSRMPPRLQRSSAACRCSPISAPLRSTQLCLQSRRVAVRAGESGHRRGRAGPCALYHSVGRTRSQQTRRRARPCARYAKSR